ncbi:hypothetical protein QJQ45_010137 [Haematococcus lacustris]|nr:hypothetical protein QJQ45_010137 [Haematococcus lacustris]
MHVSEGPDKLLVSQGAEYCSDNKAQPQTGQLWEKVLWKQQPFPDSYTPPSFLVELVVNAAVPRRQYWPVVLSSCAITQQLAVVVASCAVAAQLKAGILDATHLLLTCTLLMTAGEQGSGCVCLHLCTCDVTWQFLLDMAAGYITCAALGGHLLGGSLVRGARQGALLVGGVACLSPMLRTLAATIATDSIIALSVALMTAHLFLHDYNFVNSVTDRLSGALALAAAVLASVLLSSTMPSELHVFAQVLFSLLSFMLSPFVRRYIRAASASCHVATTAGLVCAAAWLLVPLSLNASSLFMACVLALTFVCPALLVSIHKYKAKINGPWDEAVPHIPRQGSYDAYNMLRPRGTDQRQGMVVLVDEHRTTRVSSAVNGQQPCEEELDHEQPTRGAGWKPLPGQVEQRLLRPAWSQQRDQPVQGLLWCPIVPPRQPPQAPCSSQAATQPAASEPGPSTPPSAKRTKAEQAAEPTQPTKGKAVKAKPAPQPGRQLDRDCNVA